MKFLTMVLNTGNVFIPINNISLIKTNDSTREIRVKMNDGNDARAYCLTEDNYEATLKNINNLTQTGY